MPATATVKNSSLTPKAHGLTDIQAELYALKNLDKTNPI